MMNLSTARTAEKQRHLDVLTDAAGRFAMLAVDQRQSLRKMIAARTGDDPAHVPDGQLTKIKRIVVEAVSDIGSAVLIDPVYGYPQVLDAVAEETGLLVSAEQTGYRKMDNGERRTRLVKEWTPEALRGSGIDALKLLIWHNPGASAATRQHQEGIVETVGAWCAAAGVPLLLEAKTYMIAETADAIDFARVHPEYVVDAAATYSAPRFQVDLLKLEFPTELKYAAAYADENFARSPVLFTPSEVEAACRQIDQAARVPWVILSAGVDLPEFLENIRLANEAGASGFLCGRTIWKEMLVQFPDEAAMRAHMQTKGRENFEAICAANDAALPWQRHRSFEETSSAT